MMGISKPQVIFLDAVGTLFGVQGSVGEIYSAIAQQFGVRVSPATLEASFRQSFQTSPPLAFPGVKLEEISQKEFNWWRSIARNTFSQVGVIDSFKDFDCFFTQLYQHFATADPWYVYADVVPTLQKWQEQGIELGIISNFDSRIYSVVEALALRHFFDSITISSAVSAAKPAQQIFLSALAKHKCQPQQAWHIGDSRREDYQGAIAVGMQGFLVGAKNTLGNIAQLQ